MSDPGSVTECIRGLRDGDERTRQEATRRIWERYLGQLLPIVRNRLHERVRRRVDEDDVLQEAFRSFFSRQVDFDLNNRDDLWNVLATIALRKACNAVHHHTAGIRNVHREELSPATDSAWPFSGPLPEVRDNRAPTPSEAAILREEADALAAMVDRLLGLLPSDLRLIARWKFDGCTNDKIAGMIGRTVRTVEMKVSRIRRRWLEAEGGEF